ncbi:MAG: hypothetical protein RIS29_767 [Bacteroidota bacterium]|jgi:hypothetical protein
MYQYDEIIHIFASYGYVIVERIYILMQICRNVYQND